KIFFLCVFAESRKRTVDGHVPCCPICGLTLRPGEVEAHLSQEVDKLERICRGGGRKSRDSTPSGRKTLPSPSGRKGKDSPSPEALSKSRFESYLRIRNNRQSRLNARSRNKKRRLGEETVCPICSERLIGTPEELNGHVEICLKKRHGEGGEEEPVDVEGDGDQYEEYTWAGQTRIRATTMLEGGFAASGFQTSNSKRTSEDEGDLNVDGDDTEEYGRPHRYSENDLVPLNSDEPMEDRENQALRGSLLSASERDRLYGGSETGEPTPGSSHSDMPLDLCQSESVTNAGQGALVSALKSRLKELEANRDARQKCLICMNQYQEPLVSIQCWHVHCEKCWFHTLGAKKLCPQCNMITSPSDLRRIFL
ncbi:E3 ubiquitin-protein ligase Rnf220-like, partial [Littorina saxatilis]|uniref:E3 ubiquitin-protein ligase Rnf220-like n=1 Tax=Littorina saxatilis TaxID=31220 RepID=UPI0038B43C39